MLETTNFAKKIDILIRFSLVHGAQTSKCYLLTFFHSFIVLLEIILVCIEKVMHIMVKFKWIL